MSRTSRNIRRGLIGLAAVITVACGGAPAYTTTTEYLSSGGGSQAAVDEAVLDMVWDGLSAVEQAELATVAGRELPNGELGQARGLHRLASVNGADVVAQSL